MMIELNAPFDTVDGEGYAFEYFVKINNHELRVQALSGDSDEGGVYRLPLSFGAFHILRSRNNTLLSIGISRYSRNELRIYVPPSEFGARIGPTDYHAQFSYSSPGILSSDDAGAIRRT